MSGNADILSKLCMWEIQDMKNVGYIRKVKARKEIRECERENIRITTCNAFTTLYKWKQDPVF